MPFQSHIYHPNVVWSHQRFCYDRKYRNYRTISRTYGATYTLEWLNISHKIKKSRTTETKKNNLLASPYRCWETIDDSSWWIVKTPILATVLVSDSSGLREERSCLQLSVNCSGSIKMSISLWAGECFPFHFYHPDFATEDEQSRHWQKGIQSILVGPLSM